MHALRVLLDSIIDYAGLFPPARHDMATTVRKFDEHLRAAESWMLSRLVVPAARLSEFESAAEALLPTAEDDALWRITALVADAGAPALDAEIDAIFAFNARHADRGSATVDMIELRAASAASIEQALDVIPEGLHPCFEIGLDGDPRGLIAALAGEDASAKVRTGGLTPAAFPSIGTLASFIERSAAAGVPFKATAGLHHPIRRHDAAIGAEMHGFLNVFCAAAAAWTHRLDSPAIESILAETSAGAFRFDESSATICGHVIPVDRLAVARERFARSFGSCSVDEPVEDLRALGLLSGASSP
ncbi:MAG TPA: hypothetical protein PKC43_08645 [Phycisphaerales bacterium]|nr:hypothetical protein [Phycisphaerales bacterium]HMP37503.1 hypothetical protein [Phycisphaerales bacterium]